MVYIKLNFDFCFFTSFLKRLLLIKYSLVHYSTAKVTIKRPPRDLTINVRKMKTSYTSQLYTTSFPYHPKKRTGLHRRLYREYPSSVDRPVVECNCGPTVEGAIEKRNMGEGRSSRDSIRCSSEETE